ncbi:MAG: hypothetical protein ACREHG_10685 [Candidatus Saccharimonadales bacterium]
MRRRDMANTFLKRTSFFLILAGVLSLTYASPMMVGVPGRLVFAAERNGIQNGDYHGNAPTPALTPSPVTSPSNTPHGSPLPTSSGTAVLRVSQQEINLSAGDTKWSSAVQANPGDIIEFTVSLQNTGEETIRQVMARSSNSTEGLAYDSNFTLNGIAAAGNVQAGIPISSIGAGQLVTLSYRARVLAKSPLPNVIVNTVNATGGNPSITAGSASVSIALSQSAPIIAKATPGTSPSPASPSNALLPAGFLDSFRSVFSSVLGPSDIYHYTGLPKWVNILLIVIAAVSAIASVLLLTGIFEHYIKPMFRNEHS